MPSPAHYSALGTHIFKGQTYENTPILNHGIIEHVLHDTVIYDTLGLIDFETLEVTKTSTLTYYIEHKGVLTGVRSERRFNSHNGMSIVYFTDKNDLVIDSISEQRFLTKLVRVFRPNPIHSSGLEYGNELHDNNDQSSAFIESELFTDYLDVSYDSIGKFILSTDKLQLQNLSAPNDPVDAFGDDDLFVDRSKPSFESIQAIYHLRKFSEYIAELGYKHYLTPVVIDPRSHGGADRSSYDSGTDPPILQFGIGGVDDAEDAHVILHEFVHHIANESSGHSYLGRNRMLLEEALADYLALSYSSQMESQFSRQIFSWDGHNEYWNGYTAQAHQGLISSSSCDEICQREKWLNALLNFSLDVGYQVTDYLILEFLSFLQGNKDHMEQAKRLAYVGELLFEGTYSRLLEQHLVQNGILLHEKSIIDLSINYSKIYIHSTTLFIDSKIRGKNRVSILDLNGNQLSEVVISDSKKLDISQFNQRYLILEFTHWDAHATRRKLKRFLVVRL